MVGQTSSACINLTAASASIPPLFSRASTCLFSNGHASHPKACSACAPFAGEASCLRALARIAAPRDLLGGGRARAVMAAAVAAAVAADDDALAAAAAAAASKASRAKGAGKQMRKVCGLTEFVTFMIDSNSRVVRVVISQPRTQKKTKHPKTKEKNQNW